MGSSRKKIAVASALAVLSALLMIGPPAGAQAATVRVQVGASLFREPAAKGAPVDGMRFYAPALEVHAGDTVRFDVDGFHTATLLPADTDVDAWVEDNAGGIGKPWSLVGLDPDEGEAGVKFNNAALVRSPVDCGGPNNPCPYDGSTVLNSGLFNPANLAGRTRFAATINAAVGDVVPFLCLVHINMRGSLTVVASTETTTTQAEIDDYRDQTIASDLRKARKLHRDLLDGGPSGAGPLDAYAGYDGEGFALDAMYPARLSIRQGQRVTWHFDQLTFEDHTVTFPTKKALRIASATFLPSCDPDGDEGSEPDEPGDPQAATLDDVCAGGADQVEFDIHPRFGPPAGNGVVESLKDFENSGIQGANFGDSPTLALRFTMRSEKPFTFVCMIHPFMRGKVFVR